MGYFLQKWEMVKKRVYKYLARFFIVSKLFRSRNNFSYVCEMYVNIVFKWSLICVWIQAFEEFIHDHVIYLDVIFIINMNI